VILTGIVHIGMETIMALTLNSLIPTLPGLAKTLSTLIVLAAILRVVRPSAGQFGRFLPNL